MLNPRVAITITLVGAAVLGLFVWASRTMVATRQETVPGPESVDLIEGIIGHIVREGPQGEIVLLSLPQLKETNVRSPSTGQGFIHSVSGPDRDGRIVFVERIDKRHLLKWTQKTGEGEQTIFSRSGDPIWDGVIGYGLALAPTGGRVAFVSNLKDVQMLDPPTLIQVGSLEIWDVERKVRLNTNVEGINVDTRPPYRGLSWFPDGKKIAYVELVPKDKAMLPDRAKLQVDTRFQTWDKVPAVHLLDIDTGRKSFLHVGWAPVVSSDGKTVLVHDSASRWSTVDVTTGESRRVKWPGGVHGSAIAFLEGKWVVYWGLPTSGTPLGYTRNNSPIVGKKVMLTLKVAEVDTDRFQTVLPYIDPRDAVSFGSGSPVP